MAAWTKHYMRGEQQCGGKKWLAMRTKAVETSLWDICTFFEASEILGEGNQVTWTSCSCSGKELGLN